LLLLKHILNVVLFNKDRCIEEENVVGGYLEDVDM